MEVSDDDARKKVSQLFRSMRELKIIVPVSVSFLPSFLVIRPHEPAILQ
jgi:hypothetical protein